MRIISSSQLCGGGSYRAEVFSFLLLHNKSPHSCLKRTNFFSWLLWVRSLAWLSWVLCLRYHKAQSNCLLGLKCQFFEAAGLKASLSCWLSAGVHPQLPGANLSSLPQWVLQQRQLTTWQLASLKPARDWEMSVRQVSRSYISDHITTYMQSHITCLILLVRSKSQAPHPRGAEHTRTLTAGDRNHVGHLRVCLPQSPSSFKLGISFKHWTPFLPAEIKAWPLLITKSSRATVNSYHSPFICLFTHSVANWALKTCQAMSKAPFILPSLS